MNRAALAARLFLAAALLPAVGAAGFTVYEYRTQPPAAAGTYRQGGLSAPVLRAGPQRTGLLLGTFAPTNAPAGPAGPQADTRGLAAFDQATGVTAALTVRYVTWGQPFPASYVIDAARLGAQTVVELEPRGPGAPTLAQIAAGAGSRYLASFARELAAPGDHVIVSFAPEMNGAWYSYGSRYATPADFVRAFQRVHDELARDLRPARAARLITFMWQPSAMHLSDPSPVPYWPGRRFVDLIGLDGYYFFPADSFESIFGRTIALIRRLSPGIPIMVGETAAGPKTTRQAADIRDLFAGIRRDHLLGLIWFNLNQSKRSYRKSLRIYHQDWRLQDRPAALRAFIGQLAAAGPVASFVERKAHR
jgi:glycosyl hydrolase family 26